VNVKKRVIEGEDYLIEMENSFRSGRIKYVEGDNEIIFSWDRILNCDYECCLQSDDPYSWKEKHPWTKEKEKHIMVRVSEALKTQFFSNCDVKIDVKKSEALFVPKK